MHPLAQTGRSVRRVTDYLRVAVDTAPPHEPWELDAPWEDVSARLCGDRLDVDFEATSTRLSTRSPSIIGSSILQDYQWPVLAAPIAAYLIDRRVPNLEVDHLQVTVGATGKTNAVRFNAPRFTALVDDSSAEHLDATTVLDRAALRAALRHGIEDHFAWVIEQISSHVGCSARGLWFYVADRCVNTVLWLMQELDPQVRAEAINAEIDGLVRVSGSPLDRRSVALASVTRGEHTELFRRRATCCHIHLVAGERYCSTCPHRPKQERRQELQHLMNLKHPPQEAITP